MFCYSGGVRIRPCPRFIAQALQRRSLSSLRPHKAQDRLSVLANGVLSKQDVLNCIASRNETAGRPASNGLGPAHNASAVLVSKDLARWLDDTDFMSTLIQHLHPNAPETTGPDQDLSVLTAAVDGLCPRSPYGPPSSGLSILQGNVAAILPGLWDSHNSPAASLQQQADDARPALSMRLSPLLGDFRPVDVTLPLANTVFQNARPFTLLASRWRRGRLVDALEKETQRIAASAEGGSIQAHTDVSAPLVPLTAPRRIVAGLGNIVRQVETAGGGVSQPASEELEANLHALIATRSRLLPGVPIPNRTWALVVPPKSASLGFLSEAPVSLDAGIESEHERAESFARHLARVLADGGRLHRVLSGGGGWGMKRGLLSLDPQTTFSSTGAQDLESFIASFGSEPTADSIVTPGWYVQFLVEPMPLSQPSAADVRGRHSGDAGQGLPSIILGTTPAQGERHEATKDSQAPADLIEGHFGALSSSGVYICLEDSGGTNAASDFKSSSTLTKMDVPSTYVWEGSMRWI